MRPIIDPPGNPYSYEEWANERAEREPAEQTSDQILLSAVALDWYDEQQAGEGITRDAFHLFVLSILDREEFNEALTHAYDAGRKDEREQWEPVARLALAALNSCDGEEGGKGYRQWFHDEQVNDAIKKLCELICPTCLGAGWTADRVGEACPCGLSSWEARK